MDNFNKYIVLILLVIIIIFFVSSFDVYIVNKGEDICKPLYVVKREIEPEIINNLNKSNIIPNKEYFDSSNDEPASEFIYPSLADYKINIIKDPHKSIVINVVLNTLANIPTNHTEQQVKEIVEYFSLIYNSSPNLDTFYNNINASEKIDEFPYNTFYAKLVIFLICKTDQEKSNNTNFNPYIFFTPKPKPKPESETKQIVEKQNNKINDNMFYKNAKSETNIPPHIWTNIEYTQKPKSENTYKVNNNNQNNNLIMDIQAFDGFDGFESF